MLEDVADLTLATLNEATQAWVELEYNRKLHSENGEPRSRASQRTRVTRQSRTAPRFAARLHPHPTSALSAKSDGTVVIEGCRFELPNRLRHLTGIESALPYWDLTTVHRWTPSARCCAGCSPRTRPKIASGLRRPLDQGSAEPVIAKPSTGMAPLLAS